MMLTSVLQCLQGLPWQFGAAARELEKSIAAAGIALLPASSLPASHLERMFAREVESLTAGSTSASSRSERPAGRTSDSGAGAGHPSAWSERTQQPPPERQEAAREQLADEEALRRAALRSQQQREQQQQQQQKQQQRYHQQQQQNTAAATAEKLNNKKASSHLSPPLQPQD